MACLPKERFQQYKDTAKRILEKLGVQYDETQFDSILSSKAPSWFYSKGMFEDMDVAVASILYASIKNMEKNDSNERSFFKDGVLQKFANTIATDKECISFEVAGVGSIKLDGIIKQIESNLITEKMVNDKNETIKEKDQNIEPNNTLNITPTKNIDAKAKSKGSISNKFIGYGLEGSSTDEYRKQSGDKANTGDYNSNDVIFVSINGKRGEESKRKELQNKTIDEAMKAIQAGATLVTDTKEYAAKSDYNEGEKMLGQWLESIGATYSEKKVDGHNIGIWKLNKQEPAQLELLDSDTTESDDILTNQQEQQQEQLPPMTEDDIAEKVIYSTHPCSNLFNNSIITGNDILKQDLNTVVLYTQNKAIIDTVKKKAQDNNWSIYINPSTNDVKAAIKKNKRIGIIKDTKASEVDLDKLFKDENVKFKESVRDNYKFINCNDLILFQRKIQYLYNQFKSIDANKQMTNKKVLEAIKKELANCEPNTRKWQLLNQLAEDFKNICSLCIVDEKVEQEIDEYSGDTEDDKLWSEQHSTSTMPTDEIMLGLLSSFPTGEIDELGTPIFYDPMVVNNILCSTISGAKDSDDMIRRIKSQSKKRKFMIPLLENIENDESDRLKSIIFTKYANLYKSNYITSNNGKIINEENRLASTSINLGFCSNPIHGEFIFDHEYDKKNTKIENLIAGLFENTSLENYRDQTAVQLFRQMGMSDEQIMNELNIHDLYSEYNLNGLTHYLAQAGIELTKDHDLNDLTKEELCEIRNNLKNIYWARRTYKGVLTVPQKFFKENKNFYTNIISILNTLVPIKTESIVRTAGESQFVYANKTYIDGLMDGLQGENKDEYMQSQFLDVEFFTSNPCAPIDQLVKEYEVNNKVNFDELSDQERDVIISQLLNKERQKAAYGIYNPLIRELALSDDNSWFKCFTLFVKKENSRKPKKYSELSTEELSVLNRNMFFREADMNKEREKNGERQYCLIHAPIYSDKSTLHYYRVPIIDIFSRENEMGEYEAPEVVREIKNLIIQETNRIKTTKQRAKLIAEGKITPIDKFDTVGDKIGNGERYMFLPRLNDKTQSGKSFYEMLSNAPNLIIQNELLDRAAAMIYTDLLKTDCSQALTPDLADAIKDKDWRKYNTLIDDLRLSQSNDLERKIREEMEAQGADETTIEDELRKQAIEQKSNNDFANDINRVATQFIHTSSILQLTITDPAYYKNDGGIDVQKRYAEVMAGYQRPDLSSKYARKYMRSIYLKDCEISLGEEELAKMKDFLTKAKEEANIDIDVDGIVDSMKNINVADAQSYRTLSSYRSVRDMFGQWSTKDEELYQKLQSGTTLTKEDYNQVWQTLKPFVYTQQNQEWHDENGVKHYTKIGYQYKNSEAVLFYMYNLFGDKRVKTILSGLNKFMEDYQIDTAQFESAVKVGNQGLIDLNDIPPEKVYAYLVSKTGVKKKQSIPCKSTDETGAPLPGNPEVIHEIPYQEYGIKTSTPPHLFDEEEQLGSQTKKLIQGDIPDDAKIYIDTDGLFAVDKDKKTKGTEGIIKCNGEEIKLEKDENGKYYFSKEQFLKLYNDILSDMILDNYSEVQEVFKDNKNLSKKLLSLMGTSPKYDFDTKQAVKTNKGEFVVNLKNPNIKDKLTALISSVLKNSVNKQMVRGGTAIQMTVWGGNDLKIERNEDGSIKYMECYMPAYSRKFVESMIGKDGTLKVEKTVDGNLLNALCYRIPTEDLYSIIPLKIKGFLPLQFGTNIMLPQEITTLTGSDFDVDKMYVLLPEFEMREYWRTSVEKAKEDFLKSSILNMAYVEGEATVKKKNEEIDRYNEEVEKENEKKEEGEEKREKKERLSKEDEDKIKEQITAEWFHHYCVEKGFIGQRPRFVTFDLSKDVSANTHAQKSNLLLSLMRGCISSPCNITKTQNPGGFDYLKDIVKEFGLDVSQPMNMSDSQYLNFNRLNMVAKKLIGIYANHNSAHAITQGSGLSLAEDVTVNGVKYKSLDGVKDTVDRRISRNLCEFLAAAPDNAKDPVLAKLWQNTNTANATCFMLRLGIPTKTIITLFKTMKEADEKNFNTFIEEGCESFKKMSEKYKGEINNTPESFFSFLGYYADTMRYIGVLNQILKADSTNGAMFGISDIINVVSNVKRLKADKHLVGVSNLLPDFNEDVKLITRSKSDIKKALGGHPKSFQVAYYLTFANFKKYYENVLDKDLVDELLKIGECSPRFTEDNVREFVNELTQKQLRYLDYFKPIINESNGKYEITSTQDIIDETISLIPTKLNEYKTKYQDNAFIKALDLVSDKRGLLLCVRNIADLRPETLNEIKAGFYNLYNNAISNRDADDLLHYTLAADGFKYSPTSFLSVIPVEILDKIPGMNDIFNYFEIDNMEKFEDEFMLKNNLVEFEKGSEKMKPKNYIRRKSINRFIKAGSVIYKRTDKVKGDESIYVKYAIEGSNFLTREKSLTIINNKPERDFDDTISDIILESSNLSEEQKNVIVDKVYTELGDEKTDEAIKSAVKKVLSDTNKLGRFFSVDNNPLNNYKPISIEWC